MFLIPQRSQQNNRNMRHLKIPLYSCTKFISTHLRHHYIGYDEIRIKFPDYNKSLLSIRTGLDIITRPKHIHQIITQIIIILHYQNTLQGTVDLGYLHIRQSRRITCYNSLQTFIRCFGRDKFCFMEMAISFRKSNPYTSSLIFSTLNLNLTFM